VHGVDMIRARDVNLPPPTYYSYPISDAAGAVVPNAFYNVWSFATWQTSYSISCPYPPCINALQRPILQLGAIDQFESAGSSMYNGMTVSLRKRMSSGLYFNLAYTLGARPRRRPGRAGGGPTGNGAELVLHEE